MRRLQIILRAFIALTVSLSMFLVAGCSTENNNVKVKGDGFPVTIPVVELPEVTYDSSGCFLDISDCDKGYIVASTNIDTTRSKLYITRGDTAVAYDMTPNDIIVAPINMGDGEYKFRIMQNTSNERYADVCSKSADVVLENDFIPYMIPTVYCNYNDNDELVKLAKELSNQEGDPIENIYMWVIENIKYDNAKASSLTGTNSYIPNPSETFSTRTGICFDYSSLMASMLRSIGIPAKVCVGYYDPKGLYHAWNQVYVNGEWKNIEFKLDGDNWNLMDSTFGSDIENYTPNSKEYTEIHNY